MYYMDRLMNSTTMFTCKRIDGLCIDLDSELEFDRSDFYDFVHNTPAGARKIGVYMANRLRQAIQQSSSPPTRFFEPSRKSPSSQQMAQPHEDVRGAPKLKTLH